MNKIQLKIGGISTGGLSSSYTLLLEEVNGTRKLPVVIGVLEAQSIAIEIEKIEPIRPLTHDLFKSLCTAFNLKIKEVIIHRLHGGIFYSYLVVTDGEEIKEIDSRTSDAIAIALRFNCPIYTYEEILEDAGISMKSEISEMQEEEDEMTEEEEEGMDEDFEDEPEDDFEKEEEFDIQNLGIMPVSKLKELMEKAIREEDYILAAKIRDTIKKIEGRS